MSFDILLKRVGKVAAENSPAILAALGVSGTLTTAYLAAKAGFQSVGVLKAAEEDAREHFFGDQSDDQGEAVEVEFPGLSTQEKTHAVWKLYIPAAASAALTVSAIILAVRVQERRNAALAAAYTTVEKSYAEYRAKNVEKIGKKKEQEVRDEIAQDKMNQTDFSRTPIILTKKGDTLCMDGWSGRPFSSSRNIIDKAVNDFNRTLNNNDFASLSEFWALLDLPPTSDSDYVGWNRETGLLELDWSAVVDENDEPALVYTFKTMPESRFMSAF
jgi:hypothetical protein